MATGIRIYNDSGTIQIDETYFNLVLIDKFSGSISVPTSPTATNFAVSNDVACIAVQVWPHTFIIEGSELSGGTWTFRLNFFNNPDTSDPCNYTIFAFGKAPTPSEDFGIKVLDASGGLIFHSEMKPLRVQTVSASDSGYTASPGTTIAALILEPSIYAMLPPPHEANTLRCDGSQIQPIRLGIVGAVPSGTGRTGLYAAVDVTNY